MANLAIPVQEGFFVSILADGCRPKLYKAEQKTNADGVPMFLLRARLMPAGGAYATWADIAFPAHENPFPVVEVPFEVVCSGLRVNVGENDGRKYWSLAADSVVRA